MLKEQMGENYSVIFVDDFSRRKIRIYNRISKRKVGKNVVYRIFFFFFFFKSY